tara:strand:- start:2085 stop:3443 length:1359 start_codon:yes stop_codon:yes gene_type:complete
MKKIQDINLENFNILEKLMFPLLLLLPLSLTISILIAELISSLIAIFALFWIYKNRDNLGILQEIKTPIYIILLFYIIIIISLGFSYNFNKSFLPSFFYFRYLLLSLGIFILICKFERTLKLILISLLLLLFLISIDSFIEALKINKIIGLSMEEYRIAAGSHYFITSFFDDEKKLGSFLARLCPLILSLIIFLNFKVFNKFDIKIPILVLIGLLIFFTSERTALFLFIFTIIFSLKVFKRKFILLFGAFLILSLLSISQPKFFEKYIYATFYQFEIFDRSTYLRFKRGETKTSEILENLNFSNFKYLSEEHEKLRRSGIIIFKDNRFTGIGIKTYHRYCKKIKEERSLDILCSSHPHNTYIQILSDVGIFGGLVILSVFLYIFFINSKILFIKNPSRSLQSFYMLNLGLIINLMPFVPSGSFFNNWINLMIYFPLGTWFYLFYYIKKNKKL